MPKVSVIVPVYNVKLYVRKCIESIINQTLAEIEIVLVDDGSTDGCSDVCDECAAQDRRIMVIHKRNEGLSCARNDGIAHSTAQYLMFVDGDDWVDRAFCEKAYRAAIENDADIVIFRACRAKNEKQKVRKNHKLAGIVESETALKKGGVTAWNKLYKRELFDTIQYPAGRIYEDIATTHRLILKADRIMMLPDVLYYWRYRTDSISNNKSVENKKGGFISAVERSEELRSLGFPEDTYIDLLCSRALTLLATVTPSDDPLLKKAEDVVNSIKGIPASLDWKKKIMFLIWKTDKRLFNCLMQWVKATK